jgi:RHS repeat-associated protein
VVTDAQGNIKNDSDFYPWGGELQFVNNDSNHYRFTGAERDSESGLDYMGARHYSSGLSRFMTPDPSGLAAAHPGNPQSLNLYAYALNSPLSLMDPTGTDPCDTEPVAVALAGGKGGFSGDAGDGEGGHLGVGDGNTPCLTPPPMPPDIDPCQSKGTNCYKQEIADTIKGAAPLLVMVAANNPA